jgi:hypothetical protein
MFRPGAADMPGPVTLAELIARALAHVIAQRAEADRRRLAVGHAATLPRRARPCSRNPSSRFRGA